MTLAVVSDQTDKADILAALKDASEEELLALVSGASGLLMHKNASENIVALANILAECKAALDAENERYKFSVREKRRCGLNALKMANRIASRHGTTWDEIKAGGRQRKYSWLRQELCWKLWMTGRHSFPAIADFVGYDDHTTAMHSVEAYQARLESRKAIRSGRKAPRETLSGGEGTQGLDLGAAPNNEA